jgi:tRNA (cmo5U34)-methyltransferase
MSLARRDNIFERPREPGDFVFDAEVASVFDDMLARSIPFYAEQQAMVRSLARASWQPGAAVYDLGCSRGTALIELAQALPGCERLVGYDSSEPMLALARETVAARGLERRVEVRFADLSLDARTLPLDGAGIVTACWTLQFVPPRLRPALVSHIREALAPGGALILCEKVAAADRQQERLFTELYFDFKRSQGYSEAEIRHKEAALEGVLVPLTLDDNVELLRKAGFRSVESFFRWFNFAGLIAVR